MTKEVLPQNPKLEVRAISICCYIHRRMFCRVQNFAQHLKKSHTHIWSGHHKRVAR